MCLSFVEISALVSIHFGLSHWWFRSVHLIFKDRLGHWFILGQFTPTNCRSQVPCLSLASAETVLVLGRRLLHINMHETDERGAVPVCASREAALHIYIIRSVLLPETFNRAVQKWFCKTHCCLGFFWPRVLFVETEDLPQKGAGNSQGGRRLPVCTHRLGMSSFTGASPKGLGLRFGSLDHLPHCQGVPEPPSLRNKLMGLMIQLFS